MEETPQTIEIQVYCAQEREVVGTINAVPSPRDGRVVIDAGLVWRSFIPTQEKFKLTKQPNDGDFLACPNCTGHLSLRGEVMVTKPRQRGAEKERGSIPEQVVPIVLAATAVEG